MIVWLGLALSATLNFTSPSTAHADARAVGSIVLVEGMAVARRGEFFDPMPLPGEKAKLSYTGKVLKLLDKPEVAPAFAKWDQGKDRVLKPNDPLFEGDIVQTTGNAWVKILFQDDSLVDMGPQGMLKIEKYKELAAKSETEPRRFEIILRALYGKFRSVVARHLAQNETYHVLTPSMRMQVRGTEFIYEIANDKTQVHSKTSVLGVRGAVTVDIAKVTEEGLVYHHPVVLQPGYSLVSNAEYGVTEKTNVAKLTTPELKTALVDTSPQVLAYASALAGMPKATQLLGTGYALYNDVRVRSNTRIVPTSAPSSFDYEHPPTNRVIASPSQNFTMPKEIAPEPFAVGHIPNVSQFLGPQPVDRVPLRGTVTE